MHNAAPPEPFEIGRGDSPSTHTEGGSGRHDAEVNEVEVATSVLRPKHTVATAELGCPVPDEMSSSPERGCGEVPRLTRTEG